MAANLDRLQKSKKITAELNASAVSRLKPTLTYDNFKTLDMVIEVCVCACVCVCAYVPLMLCVQAVIENIQVKQNVFAELEAACSPTVCTCAHKLTLTSYPMSVRLCSACLRPTLAPSTSTSLARRRAHRTALWVFISSLRHTSCRC